jgi:putative ABC transport system permease protein
MIAPLLGLAFQSLWGNKLRSGLTLLGVLVGVMSVMTIVSALEGIQEEIVKDIRALGPSTFIVTKMGMVLSDEMWWEKMKRKQLDYRAPKYIEEGCDLCETMSLRNSSSAKVKAGNKSLNNVSINGSEHTLIDIVDMNVAQGRFMSREDDLYHRPVAFIGDFIREEFFSGVDPIGKEIRINGYPFTVIGIAKKKGASFGNNQDNFVRIPISVFNRVFGERQERLSYFVKAVSVEQMQEAIDQVRVILRSYRNVPFNKPDDFDILTADNVIDTLNNITRTFRVALVGISSISLVVGGIVVMNIMMVSVTERTREIGIRKSVGAKQGHIMLQFLLESLITTLTGGLIGILVGYMLAKWGLGALGMDISPSAFAIFSGLSVSTGIGLIFGIYPAMKAARLDPIKALSYE